MANVNEAVIDYRCSMASCDSSSSSESHCDEHEAEVMKPPLEIERVDLLKGDIIKREGITFFHITFVEANAAVPQGVWKRYSEFRQLAKKLDFDRKHFPRKVWPWLIPLRSNGLEKRRFKLEAWLRKALEAQQKRPDMRHLLRKFLLGDLEPALIAPSAQTPAKAAVEPSKDRRIDPDDGLAYTLAEFTGKYEGVYSKDEASSHFLNHCAHATSAATNGTKAAASSQGQVVMARPESETKCHMCGAWRNTEQGEVPGALTSADLWQCRDCWRKQYASSAN